MKLTVKIFGWILLLAGVAIIGWALYSSYNIFTGKVAGPEIFELSEEKVKAPLAKERITGVENIQFEMEKMIREQLEEILSPKLLAKMLNLIVWGILAGLLIFGGSQIAGLGIKLIKK